MNQDNFNVLLTFFIGTNIGSFINLISKRISFNESIINPRSYCDNCHIALKWYQKIPIISQVALYKCKNCNYIIPFSYSFVETLLGIAFVVNIKIQNNFLNSDHFIDFFAKSFFVSILLLISLIDIDKFRIPNELIIIGYVSGILISIISTKEGGEYLLINKVIFSVIIFLVLELLSRVYYKLRNKIPFGSGDSKLISVLTLWLGLKSLPIIFFLSTYLIILYLIYCLLTYKNKYKLVKLPFAPFICLSSYIVILLNRDFLTNLLFIPF